MNDYYPPPPTLPPGSEVIAYTRDSGGPNQQESIGQQTRVIQDYCKTYGLVLSRIYAETASGRKAKNRPQFLAMCEYVRACPKEAKPRALIVWAYSRFSRDVVDFNVYFFGLIQSGVIVHSITEPMPEGIAGQMLLQVKAFTNQDFSEQLGKNIQRGIKSRVEAGYSNGGTPPKGYIIKREYQESKRTNGMQRIGVKWEADPILAPLIRKAWELRAQGASYTEITKATGGKIYTSHNSWVTHFQNESYLGIGKAGKERFPDHHEALITHELWEAVRKVESINRKRYHFKRMKHPYLLAGLAICLHCKSSMVVHTSGGYRCYVCGKRDRKKGFSDCPNSKRVNAPKAERLILDIVLSRILSPDFTDQIIADVQSEFAGREKIDREIGEASTALVSIQRKIVNLTRLVEDGGEIKQARTRITELQAQEKEYEIQIRELKARREHETITITPAALALVLDIWREQIQNSLEQGEIITARKLLSKFVEKIELAYNKAVIYYTYPMNSPITAGDDPLCAHNKKTVLEAVFLFQKIDKIDTMTV